MPQMRRMEAKAGFSVIPPFCPICGVKHYPNEQHRLAPRLDSETKKEIPEIPRILTAPGSVQSVPPSLPVQAPAGGLNDQRRVPGVVDAVGESIGKDNAPRPSDPESRPRGRPRLYPDIKTRNREYMRKYREKKRQK